MYVSTLRSCEANCVSRLVAARRFQCRPMLQLDAAHRASAGSCLRSCVANAQAACSQSQHFEPEACCRHCRRLPQTLWIRETPPRRPRAAWRRGYVPRWSAPGSSVPHRHSALRRFCGPPAPRTAPPAHKSLLPSILHHILDRPSRKT